MEYVLYHAGVKGMKWGVRNDKTSGGNLKRKTDDSSTAKIKKRGNITTISAEDRKRKQKAKLTVNANKGAKLVAKSKDTKLKVIVSNTASIASGALWVASAFVPGMPVLNTVAAATNLVGIATAQK